MSFNVVPSALPFAKREPPFDDALPADAGVAAGPAAPRVVLVPQLHPLRAGTEACIRTVYERAYGARDLTLPRMLIAWVGQDDRPLCAAGFRTAGDGFFSEIYLNTPIERALQRRTGRPVARSSIMEVTTLASRSAEASSAFVRQIAAFGKEAGFAWSFFTATLRLRQLLSDLGIPTFVLAEADPRRVPDPAQWGSYYSHAPHVCAVKGDWIEDDRAGTGILPAHA